MVLYKVHPGAPWVRRFSQARQYPVNRMSPHILIQDKVLSYSLLLGQLFPQNLVLIPPHFLGSQIPLHLVQDLAPKLSASLPQVAQYSVYSAAEGLLPPVFSRLLSTLWPQLLLAPGDQLLGLS